MKRAVVLLAVLTACHHAPTQQRPAPTTAAAPAAPANYQDTAAKWAGVKARQDSAASPSGAAASPSGTAASPSGAAASPSGIAALPSGVAASPGRAGAAPGNPPPTDSASVASAEWQAANLAIGDGVFIVRAHYGGRVYIGAGDPTQTMTLQVDADAVNDFVAEIQAVLPPKKPKGDRPPPVLEEPKSGRTMSFGRHVAGGRSRYRFFFSDDRMGGFSLSASLTETRAILAGLTRGAALSRQAQSQTKSP